MIAIHREAKPLKEHRTARLGKARSRLLILRPRNIPAGQLLPGLLWIHGGGYISGMKEMVYFTRGFDPIAEGSAVVVSPGYTHSFRKPYPAALEDCYAALVYMKEHARELGIRDDQIFVGGESAGGGLTAALCMAAKDRGEVNIACQLPLYPMLDCFDTPSSRDNHAKGWNTRKNRLAWRIYLRGLGKGEQVPCYASPSRREDYAELPPCYTFVGDLEPFLDETKTYVEKLREAGVEAEADVWPGFWHAYDVMHTEKEDSKRAAERFREHFREACRRYFAPQGKRET